MNKPMTLPSYGYQDKSCGRRQRVPSLYAGGEVVVRGAAAGFTGWLRRFALTQYSRLVFSVLDGLRTGRSCVSARRPRNFQGLRNTQGAARPLSRHAGDWLCSHLRDLADMAGMNNVYE
jgi:hypothetical protein